MSDGPGLFDMDPTPLPEPDAKISPDRRRTTRQQRAINNGAHPLALVFGPVAFARHPDTKGQTYSREDSGPRPHTCGSCRFRVVLRYHNSSYPKCVRDDRLWLSHGASTDVRRWWPACNKYEAGDSALSPDAARCPTEAL